MKLDTFNFEDINKSQSIEFLDEFDDALEVEITKSFENLAFLDTYTAMQQKNSAEMIRMCKKLSVNYGFKSGVNEKAATSIESICNIQSTEDENKDGEKKSVFKRILSAIKKIFKAIGDFFIHIWEKIKQFFIVNVGKIEGDLSADQIKALVSNEKVWKGAPNNVITGGVVKTEEFKTYVDDFHKVTNQFRKTLISFSNMKTELSNLDSMTHNFLTKYKTSYKNILSIYTVKGEEYNDGIKNKVAEWAGKASNLKSAIESIKSTEKHVKEINSMCRMLNFLCDGLEKVDKDANSCSQLVDMLRKISKVLNVFRDTFADLIKAIIFAKKLYNIGKRSDPGESNITPNSTETGLAIVDKKSA